MSGDMMFDEKLKILLWLSGLSLNISHLKAIPGEIIIDVIVCLHLFKNNSLTMSEAECMMQTIMNSDELQHYPKVVDERAFRLTMLYSKMFYIFQSCIAGIGLKIFMVG